MQLSKLLLLSTIIGFLSTGIASGAQPSIAIAVSAPKYTIKTDSKLTLNVEVTNISDHEIHLPYDKSHKAELNQYRFNITRSDGQPVLMMKYYWKITGKKAPRKNLKDPDKMSIIVFDQGSIPVNPGKTLEYQTILNELYDLSQAGEYTIQVEKTDPVVDIVVKSDKIGVILTK